MRCLSKRQGWKEGGHRSYSKAFTLLELLAVVGVLAVVAALIFPFISSFRSRAGNAACVSNLRQISAASVMYSLDNDGQWPANNAASAVYGIPVNIYALSLLPYLGYTTSTIPKRPSGAFKRSPFVCPADVGPADNSGHFQGVYTPSGFGLSYGQNLYVTPLGVSGKNLRSFVREPAKTAAYVETKAHYVASNYQIIQTEVYYQYLLKRHLGTMNAAFVDGHIEMVKMSDITDSTNESAQTFWAIGTVYTGN